MGSLISLLGMAVLIAIAVIISKHRTSINLRTVLGAFAIQFCIGALILYVPAGQAALAYLSNGVSTVLAYGNEGIDFLFGGLVSDKMFEVFGSGGFIFAFRVLPAIIFFSSLIAVLHYLGIMQWLIKIIGGGLAKLLGTSKTESMSAAANIFVGLIEAPLMVRPYVNRMTESELFAIMCGGLASVAGAVLFAYASMGVPMQYLLAASFMAAPGGLLFAKLMLPETKNVEKIEDFNIAEDENAPVNVLDAAASGASTGMKMTLNVGAMLLAFIGLIALFNGIVGGVGGWFNYSELSLEKIFGWIFSPLAWLIGVEWSEAQVTGSLIGQKLVINEFVAYGEYTKILKEGVIILSDKTQVIIAFALCGFANIGSIAILVGGLGIIAPDRRKDVARLGIRAVIAGSLSNLMSATIAGLFIGLSGVAGLG